MIAGQLRASVHTLFRTPFAEIVPILREVVWSAARLSGRKVHFEVEGEHLDIDRGVADALVEVATHLLRNAVDHGLESPEQRMRAGKPETGRVWLRVRQSVTGGYDVEIGDDGAGIDVEALRAKVGAQGASLDLFDLLCTPGLSTAGRVSELSGRGLGMDIVRQRIRAVGGEIVVETEQGRGTRFTMRFPATLREMEVLVAASGTAQFAIPGNVLERVLDAHAAVAADGTIGMAGKRFLVLHPGALLEDRFLASRRLHHRLRWRGSRHARFASCSPRIV